MDPNAVLMAFERQVRRDAEPLMPGERVEREERVVRVISGGDGWCGVIWSDIDAALAGEIIAGEIDRFSTLGRPWEWKHYSWDQPADLAARLLAAGFTPEPPEAVLVGEMADLPHATEPPQGVTLVPVVDEGGVASFVSVHDEVFGGDATWIGEMLLADLARETGRTAALLAVAGRRPIGAVRFEFPSNTDFAALYGACTVDAWRGRGVFRSLLARGVTDAAERGFRYLQTDAMPDSRPILRRLGCVELGTTTPFVHPGAA